jgi:hypothetical protein
MRLMVFTYFWTTLVAVCAVIMLFVGVGFLNAMAAILAGTVINGAVLLALGEAHMRFCRTLVSMLIVGWACWAAALPLGIAVFAAAYLIELILIDRVEEMVRRLEVGVQL